MNALLPRQWRQLGQRLWQQASAQWAKWTLIQKLVLGAVTGVTVLVVALLLSLGAGPPMVALVGAPIAGEHELLRVTTRLDQEGAEYQLHPDNRIFVADADTARRLRAILIREELIPLQTDPFALFEVDRFSMTDFERNVNLQRALTRNLEQHIEALDGVAAANVTLVVPERELFAEDQHPTTASIIITPAAGSDILDDRKKVAGVQRLVQLAVEGLAAENIVILDHRGIQVNGGGGNGPLDRMSLAQDQITTKFDFEQRYKREIMAALEKIFTAGRVQIVKLDLDLDLSATTTKTEEHFPITMRADDPQTAEDETVTLPSVTVSREEQRETAGDGGESTRLIENEVVNRRSTVSEKSPWTINRISVSVALDGVWTPLYRTNGRPALTPNSGIRREYTPVSADELRKAKLLIEHAIGLDPGRGDSVTVEHLQFDRSVQFRLEDAAARAAAQRRRLLPAAGAVAAAVVVLVAVAGRGLARRRRRMLLAAGLASGPAAGPAVAANGSPPVSPERRREEMQSSAVSLARNHPEDAARALRTWLTDQ